MTTPTNEEVRRQFEAWSRSGEGLNLCYVDNRYTSTQTRSAWNAYQAALSSPAVVALVEALRASDRVLAALGRDAENSPRVEARAALAQYATLAGEIHD